MREADEAGADADELGVSAICFRKEVVGAWAARVGAAARPAPADRVQAIFNDLHLYPTKTQVFEMLVCARQCARRASLALTFGEFCVFAAELRRAARRKQISSKPESPFSFKTGSIHTGTTTIPPKKESVTVPDDSPRLPSPSENGTEASPPPYEVFLGGSCNPTTWRSDIAIPMLEKMGITYFNPQVANWSYELIEIEHRAKQMARALLFVLDAETRAAAATVEAAHLAASGRDLLLVLHPYRRGQAIAGETITDQEYVELSRARATLQEAAERRGLPVFADVPAAVRCAKAVLRGAAPHAAAHAVAGRIIKLKRAFDAADSSQRGTLTAVEAMDAVRNLSGAHLLREQLDDLVRGYAAVRGQSVSTPTTPLGYAGVRSNSTTPTTTTPLPYPSMRGQTTPNATTLPDPCFTPATVDFEMFCAIVAEVTVDGALNDSTTKNGMPASPGASETEERCGLSRQHSSYAAVSTQVPAEKEETSPGRKHAKHARKLSVFIPKVPAPTNGISPGILTPHTAQRLEQLPSMLADDGFNRDVYLGGSCPTRTAWREKVAIPILDKHNLTYHVPKINDYSRMFSAPPHTPLGPTFTFEPVTHPNTRNLRTNGQLGRTGSLYTRADEAENRPQTEDLQHLHKRLDSRPRSGSDGTLRQHNSSVWENELRVPSKHERSPTTEEDQPEKRPKILREESFGGTETEVEVRNKAVLDLETGNRLSASDFYRVSENASPLPFKGMYEERQLWGSRVLLFAITRDARCVAPMALAAHYMGLRPRHTVLCVQIMDKLEGLSEMAVKDYNRGRHYLVDLAKREGIPVFDNFNDAMQCVIAKLSQP